MMKIKRNIIVKIERNEKSMERLNYFVFDFPYYEKYVKIARKEIIYNGPEITHVINYMDYDRNFYIKVKKHTTIVWG